MTLKNTGHIRWACRLVGKPDAKTVEGMGRREERAGPWGDWGGCWSWVGVVCNFDFSFHCKNVAGRFDVEFGF